MTVGGRQLGVLQAVGVAVGGGVGVAVEQLAGLQLGVAVLVGRGVRVGQTPVLQSGVGVG